MSAWLFGLLFLCGFITCGYSSSSSSSNTYTAPRCGDNNFYCPVTQGCLPRSKRCTGDVGSNAGSTQCQQTTYTKCDVSSSGAFQAYLCSTKLQGIANYIPQFACLQYKKEHQFITYRGLMYEFGKDYGTRVQDPLDPNYEYRPGGRSIIGCSRVATSTTCTYDQMMEYEVPWTRYKLCSYNCQDFAAGLRRYIAGGCRRTHLPNGRKRQEVSDLEFARYIFNLAGDNCTSIPDALATPGQSTPPTTTNSGPDSNSSGQSIVPLTLSVIVMGIAALIL